MFRIDASILAENLGHPQLPLQSPLSSRTINLFIFVTQKTFESSRHWKLCLSNFSENFLKYSLKI